MKELLNSVPEVESDFTYLKTKNRTVGWGEGQAQLQNVSSSQGLCLRVLCEGGQGVSTTNHLSGSHLKELFRETQDIARLSPRDTHRRLAKPTSANTRSFKNDSGQF